MPAEFRIIGEMRDIETIAVGSGIRDIRRLRRQYGGRRWRKLKGTAVIEYEDGRVYLAEVHWYECHGIGRRRIKAKRHLEER